MPTLRNVALKTTFMHNGMFTTLQQVFGFYDRAPGTQQFPDNQDPVMATVCIPPPDGAGGAGLPYQRPGGSGASATRPFPSIIPRSSPAGPRRGPARRSSAAVWQGPARSCRQIIAVSPPMIGNIDFRVGLDRALGGATAAAALAHRTRERQDHTLNHHDHQARGRHGGWQRARDRASLLDRARRMSRGRRCLPSGSWMIPPRRAARPSPPSPGSASSWWQPGMPTTCEADMDNSGTLAPSDIFSFISAWFAGDPRSDFDHSGTADVSDVFAYLAAWFAGC